MRRKSYAGMNCSVARALDVVGDPWTLLVVRDLFWGYHRFEEIQKRLGIARNTLTDRLGVLVEHGIVERVAYQDNPERFEYLLTPKGRALHPVILTLLEWGDEWSGIEEPPVHLVEKSTGRRITPVLVDADTGTPLSELVVLSVHVDSEQGPRSATSTP